MLDSLTPPFDISRILANKRAIRRQLVDREGLLEKRIALLGGSTLGEIRTVLELFLLDRGIRPVFYQGAHASYFEELAFPNPALSDFAPDIIYVHKCMSNGVLTALLDSGVPLVRMQHDHDIYCMRR